MNVAYRGEGDVQTAGSDRGQAGVVDVTDTRAAPSKATTAFVQAMASQISRSTAQEVSR
jgi:hypothetical protein